MLIDWTTARVPLDKLSSEARDAARAVGDRICCYCPKTGESKYETSKWENIRSDSHQISTRCSTDFWIQGSPARIIADGDAVFGAGPSRTLDLRGCVDRMRRYVGDQLGIQLPGVDHWIVSRVDVTGNLKLDSEHQLRQSLKILRDCEGGRYRIGAQYPESVYWSSQSKLRSGKAYGKGAHLEHLMKQKKYEGRRYDALEIMAAKCLLRLELKLGREWFARNDWTTVTPQTLKEEWESYFHRMIGGTEVKDDESLLERILCVAKTEGQGRAAYGCWIMIQNEGWERAQSVFPKRTWYRHLKILRQAGLADADISAGNIVPLRRKIFEAQHVTSWQQLTA